MDPRQILIKMFNLASFKDIVRLPPDQFDVDLNDALVSVINHKFGNKVCYAVHVNVGLSNLG